MKHSRTAVIYTRVSTDDQAEHGTSLEAQRAACLQKAQAAGVQVVGFHTDEGVSGAKYLTRNGIQAAIADIEEGKACFLLAYDVSRLSRDRSHQDIIRKRVAAAGGRLLFVTQTFEDSADGELLYNISGDFAAYERAKIKERMMSGKRKRVAEGVQVNRSRPPYGYHIVNHRDVIRGDYSAEAVGKYVIVEEQAGTVREIFTRYAAGVSLRQIAAWLNAEGIPTPRGAKQWEYKTIQLLLGNPVYKGEAYWGRLETLHDETLITERGRTSDVRFRARPQEEWAWLTAPALVDAATWEACQERRQRNKELLSGNPRRKFMLTSLVYCPVCGSKMAGSNKKGYRRKDGTYNMNQYYICHPLRNGCPEKYYPAASLETVVVESLSWLVQQPHAIADALRAYDDHQRARNTDTSEETRRRLLAEWETLETRERKTAEAQVDALIQGRGTQVYDQLLGEISRRKSDLQARLQALAPRPQDSPNIRPEADAEKLANIGNAIVKVLTAEEARYSAAEKQALLAAIVERVTPQVDGGRVDLLTETVYSI